MYNKWLLLLVWVPVGQAADACNPLNFTGPYAFQLAGTTTISGAPQSAASLGRLVFGDSGKVTGTSSVMFNGLLLGNPVTGNYEAKPDCTVTWQLQDDSGAYQHFSGKMSANAARVEFRQTDQGGIGSGVMEKTSDSCTQASLHKIYTYGNNRTIDTTRDGNFQVDSDCSVHFTLKTPGGDTLLTMRGFIVNGGKRILAFQTDPGSTANHNTILTSKEE
jgi:hypothetical protein